MGFLPLRKTRLASHLNTKQTLRSLLEWSPLGKRRHDEMGSKGSAGSKLPPRGERASAGPRPLSGEPAYKLARCVIVIIIIIILIIIIIIFVTTLLLTNENR